MIIHDDFVFVHTPRTAGTFFQNYLCQKVPGCISFHDLAFPYAWDNSFLLDYYNEEFVEWFKRIKAKDNPVEMHSALNHCLPTHLRPDHWLGKRVFFFVRNPIRWWVSHYNKKQQLTGGIEINQFVKDKLDKNEYPLDIAYQEVNNLKGKAYAYCMKYEFLYSNIIHMMDDIGLPLDKNGIQDLLDREPLNESFFEESAKKLTGKTIQLALKTTNQELQDFYYDRNKIKQSRCFMGG